MANPFNFVYPEATEIFEIQSDLISRDEASRVGLQICPDKSYSTVKVRWAQEDNIYGLMQFRGMNGQPSKVNRLGTNIFEYEPGIYGEFQEIEEQELLTRASVINPTTPIPIDDLVFKANRQLIGRMTDRKEYNVWTLLGTGTLSITGPGPSGPTIYTDIYPIQTFTATTPWSSTSTATPIANLQSIQQKWVGHSVDFGAAATLYVNQVQANYLLNNTNASDYGGRRDMFGATINNIDMANSYFKSQNLPSIVIYDQGYQNRAVPGVEFNPALQFSKFIPTGTGILVGKRTDGGKLMEFQQTINLMNANRGSGPYSFIKDYANGINAAKEIPGKIQVHRGFSGGPALLFPSGFVSCTL